MRIIDDNNLALAPQVGDWGIEIEVEANNYLPAAPAGWKGEHDGSLRGNAVEYVLRKPLGFKAATNKVDQLVDALAAHDTDVVDSFRAGVHIHMNLQQNTKQDLINIATLYYMLEPLLMMWCGEDRAGNFFCLSGGEAEDGPWRASRILRSKTLYALRNEEQAKYAGMNFCTIPKYGSLEFRGLPTIPGFGNIEPWIRILQQVKLKGMAWDIDNLFADFSMTPTDEFLVKVFGDDGAKLFSEIKRKDELLFEGMRVAQDFYYGTKG